ncbi:MAG TPA: P-loop NTPase fold protein [Chryseolinea sp.]|nr:P-loop NTPase fold protein [Chryseolinea sp.]HPM30379.1 P-loop NTPase fold protein [Chryseolinea sp.]
MAQRPFTIGITGGSGSGKTHFIKKLEACFAPDEICLVSQDHYYKDRELQVTDDRGIQNFDLPNSIDQHKLHDDILTLKRGEKLFKTEYTFNNPAAKPKVLEFNPAPILIIEGLFVQYFPEIESELDLRIFIEAKDHVKLSRRIVRDSEERGYDLTDVLYRYQHHVMPVYESLIEPLKHNADFIIPNNGNFDRALKLICQAMRTYLVGR